MIALTAHALKGSAANFGAAQVSSTAQELEFMGRDRNLDDAEASYEQLATELECLTPVLATLVAAQ
jgi:HPt (histidine-containing phosphotransfer) domain-containing protein